MNSDEINDELARLILQAETKAAKFSEPQPEVFTCIDPAIGRWLNTTSLDDLLSVLAFQDNEFVEAFPTLTHFTKKQRQELIIEIRNHLDVCLHCYTNYRHELEFTARQLKEKVSITEQVDKTKHSSSHLFLCHSSADKKFVRKLASNLTELGVRVWLDEWQLRLGDSLHDCIDVALSTSSFVGVVISPNSMNSRWCKEELNAALSKEIHAGSKIVLPLLYRGAELPSFLADRLYLDFRRRQLPALANLAAFIHNLDQREFSQLILQTRLKSLQDVIDLLVRMGWRDTTRVYVPRKEFEIMLAILKKAGVRIDSEEFQLKELLNDGGYGHITTVMK